MVMLKCKSGKCGHPWDYKGNKEDDEYVGCPKCRYPYKKKDLRKNYLEAEKRK